MTLKRRIKELEKQTAEPGERRLVVDWSEEPTPPRPGVRVVTWDDIDGGGRR